MHADVESKVNTGSAVVGLAARGVPSTPWIKSKSQTPLSAVCAAGCTYSNTGTETERPSRMAIRHIGRTGRLIGTSSPVSASPAVAASGGGERSRAPKPKNVVLRSPIAATDHRAVVAGDDAGSVA